MARLFGKRDILTYSQSARQDFRPWAMFVVGAIFVVASLSIDPQDNCSEAGECAPWLVPIAFILGTVVGVSGLARLLANPASGSRIDQASGELVWWQNRYGESGGDEGRIDPAQISRIRIVKHDEASNEIHLYDSSGARLAYFDEEVVCWDLESWAAEMARRWPHIAIELRK